MGLADDECGGIGTAAKRMALGGTNDSDAYLLQLKQPHQPSSTSTPSETPRPPPPYAVSSPPPAEEPVVVEVQQVVDLFVGRATAPMSTVMYFTRTVADEAVRASAGGELIEPLHDEEGQLFLEEEQVVVHVLHRPRRVVRGLFGLEEELHQEAPVQEQRLRLQQGQRKRRGWKMLFRLTSGSHRFTGCGIGSPLERWAEVKPCKFACRV
jgi:hypothetical protein